jgi:hypothetical protein
VDQEIPALTAQVALVVLLVQRVTMEPSAMQVIPALTALVVRVVLVA